MNDNHILVIEDNDFVRMQICKFLQDEGFSTTEASDGKAALENDLSQINLIIADVKMEPMNGFDFVRNIRAEEMKTPVILVTGDENSDLLSEAGKLNIGAILKKPVQKERLIKTVTRILQTEKQ